MVEDLSKKVVLITGCSSGIGLVTSVEMARSGFRVFSTMRNLNKRADLEAAAKEANVSLDILELDVTKKETIDSAIAEIDRRAGPVDILVNNAGFDGMGFAEEMDLKDLRLLMDINFYGVVMMTKAVIPKMRQRRTGHVITIGSLSGLLSIHADSAYSASKFAVEGYMEALRLEGLLDGYSVSIIEPGFFKTQIAANMKCDLIPQSPHYQAMQTILNFQKKGVKKGSNPLDIAKLIIKIANNKKPRFRYPIGKEKFYLFLKQYLPEPIYEKLLTYLYQKNFAEETKDTQTEV